MHSQLFCETQASITNHYYDGEIIIPYNLSEINSKGTSFFTNIFLQGLSFEMKFPQFQIIG